MKIVITIPAYNEEDTIADVIRGIRQAMDKTEYMYKIIVVNDGSTDNTANVSKEAGAIVYSHPYNYGLAETFRTEMKKALEHKADIIVHIDADGQYRAEEIPKLIDPIINGESDFVLGSRFAGTIEEMPFIKKFGNKLFSRAISQITGIRITDGQTGFRAFRKEVAEKIGIISTHTYTQEQIVKAVRNKFKVKEVPVYFAKRHSGKSRLMLNPVEYAVKAWVNLFRIYRDYEPLKFFGYGGAIIMFIGLGIGLYVLGTFAMMGFHGIDEKIPSIILAVLFFLAGIQILLFGFLAEMMKERKY